MNHPEQQRIAIATACGYSNIGWRTGQLCGYLPDDSECYELPDYLRSLDAMHAAENRIPDPLYADYCRRLDGMYLAITEGRSNLGAYCAHPARRAEAFLRTLNLWTP